MNESSNVDGGVHDSCAPAALSAALAQVTQAVAITDADGGILVWNAAAEDLFGHRAEDVAGVDLRDLIIPPEERSRAHDLVTGLRPGLPYVGELTVHNREGHRFQIWVSFSYVAGADGRPGHYIAVCVDLTELRQAARENEMLAGIVASSPDSIISVDLDGTVVWANPATERILGWKPEELVGQPVEVLVPPAYREISEATRQDLLNGAELPTPMEAQAVRRDGSLVDVSMMVSSYRDARGNALGTSATIHDITEEVATRRKLEAMVARHTAQFEQVSVPQAFLDLDGTFLAANDALCRLIGLSRDELVGTSYDTLLHPLDETAVSEPRAGFRQQESAAASYEVLARRADGRPLPVLIDAAVLHDADDQPYGIAIFARDLSEVREAQRRLNTQEALFRALNLKASDAAVVADAETNIIYVSPSFTEIFGYPLEDAVAILGYDLVHPDDLGAVRQIVERVVREPAASERFTMRIMDGWGRWRWVEETLTNALSDPDIGGLVANLRDVTTEVHTQQALQRSEARYRAIVETAQEGIMVIAPDGEVLFANQKMADIVGRPLEEIYEHGLLKTLDPAEGDRLAERLATRSEIGAERYEVPYRHPNGDVLQLSISADSLKDDDGTHIGSLAMVTDVTETRRAEEQLRRQALQDALTGLPNRTLLVDRLQMATARRERSEGSPVAVLFLDLDNFKMVNDSRGHEAGDKLLQAVAERLQEAVRASDTVARLGGDEFAVVCEDADVQIAQAVADRIQEGLSAPFLLDGQSVYMSTSIGIALSPPDDPSALLRHADAAMYRAKASGRRGVALFDNALARESERQLGLFTGLREALHGGRISLGYQPIVDLNTGQVVGVESLLRWVHPTLGPVPPPQLVACAEQSGLSRELDALVLSTACHEMAKLRASGEMPESAYVSVNVSAKIIDDKDFGGLVRDVLDRSGLPASALMLELTEDGVMSNPEQAVDLLARLDQEGVAIAVDDFGTGYSSLAYLQRLPVKVLKVDRSFVASVTDDHDALTIARSIVGLAKALRLRVVAEGIERADQAETMRQLGCHAGQGYLWSPAVPASDLARYVERSR